MFLATIEMQLVPILLYSYAQQNDMKNLKNLIYTGADINWKDYDNRSALHLAVCGNHFPIVKFLVELGNASTTITDYYGQTPIDNAFTLLLTQISKYLQRTNQSSSPSKSTTNKIHLDKLSQGAETDYIHEFSTDQSMEIDIYQILISALFFMASAKENIEQMSNILENFPHFEIDTVNYDYRSATHIAAAHGQLKSIEFLL